MYTTYCYVLHRQPESEGYFKYQKGNFWSTPCLLSRGRDPFTQNGETPGRIFLESSPVRQGYSFFDLFVLLVVKKNKQSFHSSVSFYDKGFKPSVHPSMSLSIEWFHLWVFFFRGTFDHGLIPLNLTLIVERPPSPVESPVETLNF